MQLKIRPHIHSFASGHLPVYAELQPQSLCTGQWFNRVQLNNLIGIHLFVQPLSVILCLHLEPVNSSKTAYMFLIL